MTDSKKPDSIVKLNEVRLAFPVLWTPRAADAAKPNEKSFSAAFLFAPDHPARKAVSDMIRKVVSEKWGKQAEEMLKQLAAGDKLCLKNGDSKSQYEGYAGNYFVNTRNKTRPLVLDANKAPLTEADGRIYAGCYVNASIELWAQQNTFGKRVNASLRGVQFFKDGDAFAGGGVAQENEFADMAEGAQSDSLV